MSALLLIAGWISVTSVHAYEVHECTDLWYESKEGLTSQVRELVNRRVTDCGKRPPMQRVNDNYWVWGDNAYWRAVHKERSGPCGGRGVGALGNMLDYRCWLPERWQRFVTTEKNEFYLITRRGANLRPTKAPSGGLASWMRFRFNATVTNGESVFVFGDKVPGADPETFEVFFPFGQEKTNFEFFKDKNRAYFNVQPLPPIQWSTLQQIPIECVPLSEYDCKEEDRRSRDSDVILARSGNDLIYVKSASPLTVFKGAAPKITRVYRQDFSIFLVMKQKTYRIDAGIDEMAVLRLVSQ